MLSRSQRKRTCRSPMPQRWARPIVDFFDDYAELVRRMEELREWCAEQLRLKALDDDGL